ncbi:MAG: hypothetical protein ISS26_00645 [Candidatus Omnitrophica bacterium]|nr:hypothetical protein [Candidatus Omnitrophota bacterium]
MSPIRRVVSKQLGELLLEKGILKKDQLDKALKIQKQKSGLLGTILVGLGYVTEEQIAQAITIQYGFPYLPLQSYEVDPALIKIIPENVARQYCLIVVDKIGNTMTIAMANPLNLQAVEDIELMSGCKVQAFVSTMTDINNALNQYYEKK